MEASRLAPFAAVLPRSAPEQANHLARGVQQLRTAYSANQPPIAHSTNPARCRRGRPNRREKAWQPHVPNHRSTGTTPQPGERRGLVMSEPTIGELMRTVDRLTSSVDALIRSLPATYVTERLYSSQRESDRREVEEIDKRLDKNESWKRQVQLSMLGFLFALLVLGTGVVLNVLARVGP